MPTVVDRDRTAVLDLEEEVVGGHVRPSPGPVDGEEAQSNGPVSHGLFQLGALRDDMAIASCGLQLESSLSIAASACS